MPFADFLTELGGQYGSVGRAFGGRTRAQSAQDDFTNNQLPALTDAMEKARTDEEIGAVGSSLYRRQLRPA